MKISFIGAGSIAEAMITGILEKQICSKDNIYVTNRQSESRLMELKNRYGIQTTYDLQYLTAQADMIILAVKPKDASQILKKLKPFTSNDTLIVSVMAGVSIATIIQTLGNCPIARSMPNTSATVGKSATAICFNDSVSEKQKQLVNLVFNSIGITVEVQENQLDLVTALSGSGPAYFYYIVETMEQTAQELGLDKKIAKQLIIQTLKGTATMLDQSNKDANELRKNVTSPGGTTEAGIQILNEREVDLAFSDCIKAATTRAKQLGTNRSN